MTCVTRAQLKLVRDDLITTLAEQHGKDGRNVALTALRKRLAFVHGLIQRCNVQSDPRADFGNHPI